MRLHHFTSSVGKFLVCGLLAVSASVFADAETAGVESIADRLHAAIAAGDEQALRSLLDPELLVFESGGVESSLEEYASHHMGADTRFMAGLAREVLNRTVMAGMPVSVVSTRSRLTGEYNDRPVDLFSNETLVIHHGINGSHIVHIHWSSTDAR